MIKKIKKESKFNKKFKVTCKCGHEIVLIPDVHIMSKAIEDHVLEHISKDPVDEKKADLLRSYLITQALNLAAGL